MTEHLIALLGAREIGWVHRDYRSPCRWRPPNTAGAL